MCAQVKLNPSRDFFVAKVPGRLYHVSSKDPDSFRSHLKNKHKLRIALVAAKPF